MPRLSRYPVAGPLEPIDLFFVVQPNQPAVDEFGRTVLSKKITWQSILNQINTAITPLTIGLGNVDNTSDLNKPISTATQNALDLKQQLNTNLTVISGLTPTANDVLQYKSGAWINRTPAQLKVDLALTKSDVGLGNVDNTSDANKPVSTAQQTALNGKQNLNSYLTQISGLTPANDNVLQLKAGVWVNRTPAQLKVDLALVKADVGLGNVDNTSDANKPVSTATQTALNLKADKTPTFITINNEAGLDNERALAVTANQLKKTDGGANGALTLGLADDLVMPGTVGFTPVTRTTAQRAPAPAGTMAYNSTTGELERYIGGEWIPFGKVLQVITGAIPLQSGTAQTAYNNTAPTTANGFQIWTATITPKMQTSNILILQSMFADHSNNNRTVTIALFDGTTLVGSAACILVTSGRPITIAPSRTYDHNKTSPITLTAYAGANGGGTTYINQSPAANLGGSGQSSYTIVEYRP